MLRAASFPDTHLDGDYIKIVQALGLQNLIKSQINYFDSEIESFTRADEFLEKCIKGCIVLAFSVAAIYLLIGPALSLLLQSNIPPALAVWLGHIAPRIPKEGAHIATVLGALMPAIAAALAAIRSHGEYAQIAARYHGTSQALQQIAHQVQISMPDRRRSRSTLTSAEVSQLIAATNSLFQRYSVGNLS